MTEQLRKNNTSSTYHTPSNVLNADTYDVISFLQCHHTYVILLTHPHFPAKESEVCEKLSILFEVIWLQSNAAKIWTQVTWFQGFSIDVYTWIWHGFWDRRPSSLGRKSCFQGQALFTKRHLWGRVFKKRGQLEWGHQWTGLEGSKRNLLFCGKKKRQTCQCLWVHWESAVNQLWQRRAELQASSMVNQLWPYSL